MSLNCCVYAKDHNWWTGQVLKISLSFMRKTSDHSAVNPVNFAMCDVNFAGCVINRMNVQRLCFWLHFLVFGRSNITMGFCRPFELIVGVSTMGTRHGKTCPPPDSVCLKGHPSASWQRRLTVLSMRGVVIKIVFFLLAHCKHQMGCCPMAAADSRLLLKLLIGERAVHFAEGKRRPMWSTSMHDLIYIIKNLI